MGDSHTFYDVGKSLCGIYLSATLDDGRNLLKTYFWLTNALVETYTVRITKEPLVESMTRLAENIYDSQIFWLKIVRIHKYPDHLVEKYEASQLPSVCPPPCLEH